MTNVLHGLIVGFLLVLTAACTTAPATQPPLPTVADPTAIPNNTAVSPTVAPSTLPPPTDVPVAPVVATQPPASSTNLLPNDAVWVFIDNAVVAAAPGAPKIILAEDPLSLNPHGIQVAPDGSRFTYTIADAEGRVRFYLMDTRNGAQHTFGDAANVAVVGPRFSPDAKQLAYTVIDQSGAQGKWALQLQDVDSGDARVLQQFEKTKPTDRLAPPSPAAWTAQGLVTEQLLWGSDALPHGITRIDPENGAAETLDDTDHIRAEISPDGMRAAILTGILPMGPDVDSKTTLTIRNLQSGDPQAIVQDERIWISTLTWSPDNTHLLYTKQIGIEGPITSLVITSADGTGAQTLPIGDAGMPGILHDAVWRDANTLLLLVADPQNKLHLYALATENFQPNALQELISFEQNKTPGLPPRILYVPN